MQKNFCLAQDSLCLLETPLPILPAMACGLGFPGKERTGQHWLHGTLDQDPITIYTRVSLLIPGHFTQASGTWIKDQGGEARALSLGLIPRSLCRTHEDPHCFRGSPWRRIAGGVNKSRELDISDRPRVQTGQVSADGSVCP
jgi:hypothetical protein